MYKPGKITIGIAPTRRDDGFLTARAALQRKNAILKRLREIFGGIHDVTLVDLEDINSDGMMCDLGDVVKAEKKFRDHNIDGLFLIHANFGQEEVVAQLAYHLKLPVLIWGLRDGNPAEISGGNFREADTQCGMFASTRALLRYGVTFSYIENCWIDSKVLIDGIDQFVRVVSIVKSFKGMRILQLASRPRQFLSVKINEGELMERFGIEVTPVEVPEIISAVEDQKKDEEGFKAVKADWDSRNINMSQLSDDQVRTIASLEMAIRRLADKYNCIAVASECWTVYRTFFNTGVCFVAGDLSAHGLPVGCENDIHGTISSAIISAASRMESPSFLADITVRHPTNDNAELLWHCGPFPADIAAPGSERAVDAMGKGQWELKHGELTLCRFDVDKGNYMVFVDTCRGIDGPRTNGNYIWIETNDWPKWERRLMIGPYIHHIAGCHGNYKNAIREACRFLGLMPDGAD
jgi:L-fucose isomerase-like protein